MQLVDWARGDPAADPDAPPETETEPERRNRWRWVRTGLAVVAIVVLVVELVVIVRSVRARDDGLDAAGADRVPPVPPAALPLQGALVRSVVRPDGSIAVTQWLRSADEIDKVTLSVPTPVGGRETPRAEDVRLVGDDGTVLADHLTVDTASQEVRFAYPTRLVRATYVLGDAVDRSSSVDGRVRALLVALDVDFATRTGPTVVQVSGAPAGAEVLNLACANARSRVALLRPCGAPSGSGWRVRLPAVSAEDQVTAQIDLG